MKQTPEELKRHEEAVKIMKQENALKTYDNPPAQGEPSSKLDPLVEAGLVGLRMSMKGFAAGMQSYEMQDMKYEVGLQLDHLEAQLREIYGKPSD